MEECMKKFSVFSVILILALLLAACGEAGVTDADLTATAEAGVAPGVETPDILDETPAVVDETPAVVETPMVETPMAETPVVETSYG
jgi:PBP1b-binding outer membrane lipoprotein LpoB